MKFQSALPMVDFSPFMANGDPATKQVSAEELVDALHVHGAIGITGHGISIERLRSTFAMSQKLFSLSKEHKMKAPHPEGNVPHRGYSHPGKEKTFIYSKDELDARSGELDPTANKAFDWKEHFDMGHEENKVNYNIWLPEDVFPGFRTYETELYWELYRLSQHVLDAILLGLGIGETASGHYNAIHDGFDNVLRLLHYPAIDESMVDRNSLTWQPVHTDFTTFTFLFQHQQGGLKYEDRTKPGTFIEASADEEGVLLLNVGDFLEILSNGYLPASRHKVDLPHALPGSHMTPDRYSIAYFVVAAFDNLIEPQQVGKPGSMPEGPFKAVTGEEHVAFRMKYQH